jgi:hypothetical protein
MIGELPVGIGGLADGEYALRHLLSGYESRVLHYTLRGLTYAAIADRLMSNPSCVPSTMRRIRRKALWYGLRVIRTTKDRGYLSFEVIDLDKFHAAATRAWQRDKRKGLVRQIEWREESPL